MGFGHQTINIIEENKLKQAGWSKIKPVDYCLQYGIRNNAAQGDLNFKNIFLSRASLYLFNHALIEQRFVTNYKALQLKATIQKGRF